MDNFTFTEFFKVFVVYFFRRFCEKQGENCEMVFDFPRAVEMCLWNV